MRPAEVSNDEIVEAASRLIADGKKVNGWSLRAAVGNKGKPDRLMEVWQRAEAEGAPVAAPQQPEEVPALPPGVAEMADDARAKLVSYFDGILMQVVRQGEAELKSRYKADFDRLTAERADMAEQLATASVSVGETEQTLVDALADADALRGKLAEAQRDGAVLAERLRGLEVKAQADAADAETQISALEDQVRKFGAVAQAAQQAQAAAQATAAAVEREAERLRAQIAELTTALTAARAEVADGKVALAAAEASLVAQRERADRAEIDLGRVRQERDGADTAARQAAERAGAAEQRAAQAEARAAAAEEKLSRTEGAGDDPKAH